ncbi:Uncharacterised protein [Klebsiella pneumoniae]|uniref:Uncharacterized protein n=1 Tax=Klebsiella pneumoniae TaxID=573 RepID=A0A4P0Y6E3_KLEPN|nr:Uncharacterised protein [Klebsiella pneumoniae]
MVNTNITLQVAVVKFYSFFKRGVCYASIYIKDDFFKGAIKNGSSNKCFKKIKAFNYKY